MARRKPDHSSRRRSQPWSEQKHVELLAHLEVAVDIITETQGPIKRQKILRRLQIELRGDNKQMTQGQVEEQLRTVWSGSRKQEGNSRLVDVYSQGLRAFPRLNKHIQARVYEEIGRVRQSVPRQLRSFSIGPNIASTQLSRSVPSSPSSATPQRRSLKLIKRREATGFSELNQCAV